MPHFHFSMSMFRTNAHRTHTHYTHMVGWTNCSERMTFMNKLFNKFIFFLISFSFCVSAVVGVHAFTVLLSIWCSLEIGICFACCLLLTSHLFVRYFFFFFCSRENFALEKKKLKIHYSNKSAWKTKWNIQRNELNVPQPNEENMCFEHKKRKKKKTKDAVA